MDVASSAKCFCTALGELYSARGRRGKVQEYKVISDADALQKFDGMVDRMGDRVGAGFGRTLCRIFRLLLGVGEGDDADGGGLPTS